MVLVQQPHIMQADLGIYAFIICYCSLILGVISTFMSMRIDLTGSEKVGERIEL